VLEASEPHGRRRTTIAIAGKSARRVLRSPAATAPIWRLWYEPGAARHDHQPRPTRRRCRGGRCARRRPHRWRHGIAAGVDARDDSGGESPRASGRPTIAPGEGGRYGKSVPHLPAPARRRHRVRPKALRATPFLDEMEVDCRDRTRGSTASGSAPVTRRSTWLAVSFSATRLYDGPATTGARAA
jgi:hypothetical protein